MMCWTPTTKLPWLHVHCMSTICVREVGHVVSRPGGPGSVGPYPFVALFASGTQPVDHTTSRHHRLLTQPVDPIDAILQQPHHEQQAKRPPKSREAREASELLGRIPLYSLWTCLAEPRFIALWTKSLFETMDREMAHLPSPFPVSSSSRDDVPQRSKGDGEGGRWPCGPGRPCCRCWCWCCSPS